MSISELHYNAIMAMRDTGSSLAKEKILQDFRHDATFKKIMYYTYSPYLRYHIRKLDSMDKGTGLMHIDGDTWALLNKMSNRTLSGKAAKDELDKHLASRRPAAEEIIRLIILKDLKCGIAETTINKIWPGLVPVFECQGVDDWDEEKAIYPMLISPKIDGVRGERRGDDVYTRRGHIVPGLEHITHYIKRMGVQADLSGELWVPGMKFNAASGYLRSGREHKPLARLAVFDNISLGTMPLDNRTAWLAKTFYPLGLNKDAVSYIPHMVVEREEQVDALFKAYVGAGYEGVVGKSINGTYIPGKGGHHWMRKVQGFTDEFLIVGVYESEKKPGTLGGIVIDVKGVRTNVGSGFNDEQRIEWLLNPGEILGRYATIAGKEWTKDGRIRQPIFKDVRWDI